VRSYLVSFEPHLRIESVAEEPAEVLTAVKNELDSSGLRERYTPFIEGKTAVISREFNRIARLKGISMEKNSDVYGIKKALQFGSFAVDSEDDSPPAFIGINLAEKLSVLVGDTLTVLSPAGIENLAGGAEIFKICS